MNTNLSDPFYLPTVAELKEAFPVEQAHPTDSKEFPFVDPKYTQFHYKNHNYQVYTQEFVASLAAYLIERNLKVVEVGAGDGRLTFFLKQFLNNKVTIVATDIKDWEDKGKTNQSLDVEKLGYMEAIEKYATEPILVLSCWMNVDVNWTADFRKNPNVKEYIMIGDVFRTGGFGEEWYLPENSGFVCEKLSRAEDGSRNGVIVGSVGRFDGSPHNPESRTEIYSFRRVE